MNSVFVFSGLLVLASIGCSSSTSTNNILNPDSGVDEQKACDDYASANCLKRQNCTNANVSAGAQILQLFGDMTTCHQRMLSLCLNASHAVDTGFTPNQVEKCAAAHATWSCEDLLDNIPPTECSPVGTKSNGQPCGFSGQCSTGFCSGNRLSACGVCADPPKTGDSCATSFCGHDQICVDSTQACQVRGALNASCDVATAACGAGMTCTGAGTSPKTCQTAATAKDATCGAGTPGCYFAEGLWCTGTTAQRTCAPIAYVPAGQACGTQSDGSLAVCRAGGCYTSSGPAALTDLGTCKANAGDGQSCDTHLGPDCITPARCETQDGGTSGTCEFPDAKSCG